MNSCAIVATAIMPSLPAIAQIFTGPAKLKRKLSYLLWAASRFAFADSSCPDCHSQQTVLLRRKAIVTSLWRCRDCHLMFRVPKDDVGDNVRRYNEAYHSDFI